MNPVNCKMIKLDVKLSYTRVATGISYQLGLFPDEAEVAALGHTPTYNATQAADGREGLKSSTPGMLKEKKFW